MTNTTPRPVSKAHLKRTRDELLRTASAREWFAGMAMELAATRGWMIDPQHQATWTRLDADYQAARLAYDTARGNTAEVMPS